MEKIAIVALTRGYDDIKSYESLIIRNQHIQKHLTSKSKFEFDVILFHEGNITQEHQSYIQKMCGLPLIFKDIRECGNKQAFDDSRDIVSMELCPPTQLSLQFPIGYKHMCHFWSIGLFDYLADYKYVIRMDEDVFLIEFNPQLLEYIVNENIKFVMPWLCTILDDPNVIVGLDTLLDGFCKENNITMPVNYKDICAPNTNFVMFDLQYFKNNDIVQKFLNAVDESHGIYSNRWGDAPIWGIILFALQDESVFLCDEIEYYHGSHNHHVNSKTVYEL
jgi:hypothetical protein